MPRAELCHRIGKTHDRMVDFCIDRWDISDDDIIAALEVVGENWTFHDCLRYLVKGIRPRVPDHRYSPPALLAIRRELPHLSATQNKYPAFFHENEMPMFGRQQ